MGRERSIKLSQGVRLREYASGIRTIEIQFQFRGVQCKEALSSLDPNKKSDQRYAINLKAEVENAIERQTFRYNEYFPDSKKAKIFGHAVSNITIKQLLESWLKDIERTHPHSTYRCYKKSCNAHLIPEFGSYRAQDLTPLTIREWLRNRSGTLKSIRNDLTPLRAVLDQALNDDIIDKNPLDKIKVSRDQKKSDYEVDPFTEQEIQNLLKVAEEYDPLIKNLLQFAFYTGVRTSELFGLKWGDVDWNEGTVRVQRAVVERKMKETKTKAGIRDVILTPMAAEALMAQKTFSYVGGEYIFVRPRNRGPFIDYEHLDRPWKHILKRSKVRYRNPVAQQMGHRNTEMVMRHYARWVNQGKEKQKHTFVSNFGQNGTHVERSTKPALQAVEN